MRCLAPALAALAVLCPGPWDGAAVAGTITEDDVIRLARERDPRVALAGEDVAVAEAEALRASLYPDPSLAWSREHLPGAGADAGREDTFELSVSVDLSGRRPAGRALARSEVAAAQAMAARARREAVAAALLAFYDALAAERHAAIAGQAVARLDEAARVLGRRHEQGTASGYERTRLELEAELARSDLRQAEARAQAARAELALLLGIDAAGLALGGSLETGVPGAAGQARPDTVPKSRSASLLERSVAEARDARAHARRAWVPLLSLSGGLRVADAGETRYGYVAGVALDLPLFSRGRDARAGAWARVRLAQARARVAEQTTRRELLRAQQELTAAREELGRFGEATGERLALLERAAESGYREGERSLVELLDAQRARTAVDLRRLELELAARRAEVALRAARGELE
jgi:cobalt-zinc-cadmium efflux system outer membrane protein